MVIVRDGAVTAAVTRLSAGPMSAGLSAAAAGLRQVRESGGVIGAAPVVDGMTPVMVTGAAAGGGGELELAGAPGLAASPRPGPARGEFVGPPCPRGAFEGVATGAGRPAVPERRECGRLGRVGCR